MMSNVRQDLELIVERSDQVSQDEVLAALRRLGDLPEESRAQLSPQMRHYLSRRSYQKALDHLRSEMEEEQQAG